MPWSENLVRGMQVLSKQAVDAGVAEAYGLTRGQLERAAQTTAEMRRWCRDGVYAGPITPEIYVTLAPLRVAAIEAGYRWLTPLPGETPPARHRKRNAPARAGVFADDDNDAGSYRPGRV